MRLQMRGTFLRALLITILTQIVPLDAASFDCSKATTETEIAICNDPELSALDERMSNAYLKARGSNLGEHFKQHQLNWIKTRDLCFSNAECLKNSYEEILLVLKVTSHNRVVSDQEAKTTPFTSSAFSILSLHIPHFPLTKNEVFLVCALKENT